jgi:hypothetical protein
MLYDFGLHPRERSIPDGAGSLATEVLLRYLNSSVGHYAQEILLGFWIQALQPNWNFRWAG